MTKSGYIMISRINPVTGEHVYIHEHVFIFLLKEGMWQKGICSTPEGFHVHHVDFNKTNNDPSNLVMLSHSDHRKIHSDKEEDKKRGVGLKRNYQTQSFEQRKARVAKAAQASIESKKRNGPSQKTLEAMARARASLKQKREAAKIARGAILE